MRDQAHELRRLVEHARSMSCCASRPPVVLVASGRGGDGTTTVAMLLAQHWRRLGRRTALVEADPHGGHLALLCRLNDGPTLCDVLAGRKQLTEVVRPGPGGILVVPGTWGAEGPIEADTVDSHDWLNQFQQLSPTPDAIVIDAGSGASRTLQRLGPQADALVLVTMPAAPAIMNAYALVKVLFGRGRCRPTLHCLVNRVSDETQGRLVQTRLADACQRFLGIAIHRGGWLPDDQRLTLQAYGSDRDRLLDAGLFTGLTSLGGPWLDDLAARHNSDPADACDPASQESPESRDASLPLAAPTRACFNAAPVALDSPQQTHRPTLQGPAPRANPRAVPPTSGGPAGPNCRQVLGPALNDPSAVAAYLQAAPAKLAQPWVDRLPTVPLESLFQTPQTPE